MKKRVVSRPPPPLLVLRLVVSRVLRLYATCSSSRGSNSLSPTLSRDSSDTPRRTGAVLARDLLLPAHLGEDPFPRTLTGLAINLFALLNVILFYRWIKRTGNLAFLRLPFALLPRGRMYPVLLKGHATARA